MRILIVSQYFWPEDFRINDLAIGLREKGHQVTVLTGLPNYPQGQFYKGYHFWRLQRQVHEGIEIIRVPLLTRRAGKGWQLALNYLSFVFFSSLIAPFRVRGQFDVVFSYLTSPVTAALPAILLSKLKKAPLLLWVQDLWPESVSATGAIQSKSILKSIGKLVSFIYKRADKILVSSKSFIDSVRHYSPNQKTEIAYYPNSVESVYQPFPSCTSFAEEALLPSGFKICFAGNIGEAQDFPSLIATAEKLKDHKDIHFVILGDGRRFEWLQNEVKQRDLSDTIHLLGRHPVEKMPYFFSKCDVLYAALKDEPVFALTVPCKIQSYFACAKPVLAAIAGEGGRLVEEAGAGISVAPGAPDELAAAILQLYEQRDQLELYGKNAYQYYQQHFKRDLLLAQLENHFQSALADKSCNDKPVGEAQ